MSIQLLVTSFLLCFLPLVLIFFLFTKTTKAKGSSPTSNNLPKPYPIIGHNFHILSNRNQRFDWITSILQNAPSATYTIYPLQGPAQIWTANPAIVQHILKTQFHNYTNGIHFRTSLFDILGNGIFNVDNGDSWKFQRQISSHEFNTNSLRKFVEIAVETELSERLIPFLSAAAANKAVIDFQDILQRFAFDNICKIAFGYDPAYLLPSLPQAEFARAFDDAIRLSEDRFQELSILVWKAKRLLNIGSEKRLKVAVSQVHEFAKNIIRDKKKELQEKPSSESIDLLSRFLISGQYDDNFVRDIVISFTLAGRDTTSAALTWFFWLLSKNPEVEREILKEIKGKSDTPGFEDIKEMVFTHASLCESMRFYPPVPVDGRSAENDDVLPDGTVVRKEEAVQYSPYAMGRMESIWGKDWAEFKPERWLKKEEGGHGEKWSFVGRDPYTYPVFHAGPRICLGKEMAFLQMKRVVGGVLRRFKVVPAMEDGFQPLFIADMTAKMKGGFLITVQERND
ncbi:hypothetical protein EZV62_010771 [Acer yangbiense]|uniref:Cytochrome P450 n=1 Tax=Acer yangbiense TaxID=1000413 RepID=A0A5C7I3B5_9ROSI|nr:hypothetical protein EZV62_010771 [Acer yangbiense]